MRLLNGSNKLKQGLLLFTAAYVAFTCFFAEENGNLRDISRSLQEGDSALSEDYQEGSSDDGSADSIRSLSSKNAFKDHFFEKEDTEILVIIMGEKSTFPMWLERLGSIDGSLSLLFGSFDEKIPQDACENDYDLPCQVAFINGTTWTEGRNLLAGEAVRKEFGRKKKYDYWMFLDDDVEADCSQGGWAMIETLGKGSCWQMVFNFIASDDVPENASTITLPRREGERGFAGFSSTDAMFAAFKRDRVPYLLPYVTLKEGSSQWTSQACLFCIMRTCMKSSAVFVPYVAGLNPIHRDYIRGKEVQEIRDTIADNYHDEKAGFFPCTDYSAAHIEPYTQATGTFETGRKLNTNIPPPELEKCSPMKERFKRWAREQLELESLK